MGDTTYGNRFHIISVDIFNKYMSNQQNDIILENLNELEEEVAEENHELYDDGGHVRPEVLADMIDRAKDEAEDKLLEANLSDEYSDYKEDNGNTPIGYPSDGPSWFGKK